jgi:hypothetical protein
MDRSGCTLERISNFSVGIVLLVVGILFGITSFALLPIVGLLITVPILVLAVIFLGARRSETCALISQKAKKIVSP